MTTDAKGALGKLLQAIIKQNLFVNKLVNHYLRCAFVLPFFSVNHYLRWACVIPFVVNHFYGWAFVLPFFLLMITLGGPLLYDLFYQPLP